VELLDHPALARELKNLERKPRLGGRVAVDHPRGLHDDHANALAISAAAVAAAGGAPDCRCIFMDACTHVRACSVCGGAGTLGSGTDEAPSVACYACEGSNVAAAWTRGALERA